jgi:uncharacterized membrane protein
MDHFLTILKGWDLHPVVDHFTVSLLIVGVLIDLVASMAPTRTWLRYMALTLMILGAIAAGSSYFTGDMEADRVWQMMSAPAKGVLHWHAMLGEYFAIVFGVLAVWRILIQAVGFFAGSRPLYLIAAMISAGVLIYIGHLGGQMVYTYGVGTLAAPSELPPQSSASATPEVPAASLPTVTVPSPTALAGTPTPLPMMMPSPTYTPVASPMAIAPLPTAAATPKP